MHVLMRVCVCVCDGKNLAMRDLSKAACTARCQGKFRKVCAGSKYCSPIYEGKGIAQHSTAQHSTAS